MIDTIYIKKHLSLNKEKFILELKEFLEIKSISTDLNYRKEVLKASKFVEKKLISSGVENVKIIPTEGIPVVYGEKIIDPILPTLLVYGHFDVQPADPIELWENDPFKPEIKNGKIFARGACDDKAQMLIPIKAFEFLNQSNELHCNLKFLFEGEEEVGSTSLKKFIEDHKNLLKADATLIVDTFMQDEDTPAIIYGLKGITLFELEIEGPKKDMHSGIYSGIYKNPIDELSRLISLMKDTSGNILIPNFYNGVVPPNHEDLLNIQKCAELDKANEKMLLRQWFKPSLDINGINGGYNGEGAKTIIPSLATAKISCRLVNGQSPQQIINLIKRFITNNISKECSFKFKSRVGCSAVSMTINHSIFMAAELACSQNFINKPVYKKIGGSIPVVNFIDEILGIPCVLLGFGLESDNIHSPNEHFSLANYFKGIKTITELFKLYK